MSVRYVNCFQVPGDRDDEFYLERWGEINAYMTQKPGYLGHVLHRALDPAKAKYRFVNYVEFSSPELFVAAHDEGFRAFLQHPSWQGGGLTSTGTLCEVMQRGGRFAGGEA